MADVYMGPCPTLTESDLAWLGTLESPGSGAFTPTTDLLSFSMRDVQPSVGQFVAGGDSLRFRVFTTLASATVQFRGRYLLPVGSRGMMQPFAQNVTATSAGGVAALQTVVNDGFVAQLAASVSDDTIQTGDVYVIVEAGRVESGTFQTYQQLLAGYVTVRFPIVASDTPGPPPTLPTGRQLISVADPAAGAEWTYTIGAGQIWRPIAVHFRLTTGATVANREVGMKIDDGTSSGFSDDTGVYAGWPGTFFQVANRTFYYSYVRGWAQYDGQGVADNVALPLGDWILRSGDRLSGHTFNKGATDQYSNIRILTEISAE